MMPIIGRKIRAPGLDALGSEIVLDAGGAQQARNAEERRRSALIAERGGGRGDAVVDFLPGALDRHPVHAERMILAVGADAVAGIADAADAFGKAPRHAADDEEG